MENEKYPYQKDWEEYKKRQKTYWLVFLAFLPFTFLIQLISVNLPEINLPDVNIGFLCFIVFGICWTICGVRLLYWRCPRCGNSFHAKWLFSNIFSGKCLHCKLAKYEGSSFYYGRMGNLSR